MKSVIFYAILIISSIAQTVFAGPLPTNERLDRPTATNLQTGGAVGSITPAITSKSGTDVYQPLGDTTTTISNIAPPVLTVTAPADDCLARSTATNLQPGDAVGSFVAAITSKSSESVYRPLGDSTKAKAYRVFFSIKGISGSCGSDGYVSTCTGSDDSILTTNWVPRAKAQHNLLQYKSVGFRPPNPRPEAHYWLADSYPLHDGIELRPWVHGVIAQNFAN